MLMASRQLSVVALTLLDWTMDGNASTLALSQQALPKLGWGYLLQSLARVVVTRICWAGDGTRRDMRAGRVRF